MNRDTRQAIERISGWKDSPGTSGVYSWTLQLLLCILCFITSRALYLTRRGREALENLRPRDPDTAIFVDHLRYRAVEFFTFLPDVLRLPPGSTTLDIVVSFISRMQSVTDEELIDGLRRRLHILFNVCLPDGDEPNGRLAHVFRWWALGCPWDDRVDDDILHMIHPGPLDANNAFSNLTRCFSGLQDVADYLYTVLTSNHESFSGQPVLWTSINNGQWSVLFTRLFAPPTPGRFGMLRENYAWVTGSTLRGDACEALVSYVLPELHDYCSMFLALIAIVRVIHGREFPSGIERFLRAAADPSRPERLRRLKDPPGPGYVGILDSHIKDSS
ncbi:hypothetical protein FOZ63_028867 [Perkinsus olseni]|uniref:Uncharacterized protein n=1 Tax=Perkinsus olseni TaxID=32597 RepID=A0A7J6R9L6_PEROL|nr:hypothetical protein FOZ63_028867 [Perkinsus olseni]